MENEDTVSQTQEESSMVYVIGAVIVVAVIVAAVIMWPKSKTKDETAMPTSETSTSKSNVVTKPTLTKLSCESEWFNPVVGLPKYYLSAEGGDVSNGNEIECTFHVIKDKDTILTETIKTPVTAAPERGGTTFRCTTKALEKLPQGIPVTLVTIVKNSEGQTASCSGKVTF